ncbi:MAG: 30S ribosomal protein S6 [Candidatus Staskawiczbacteria bacterium]|nr:30S ribosomal protein S6 [Candidatus Staskawiczbacteria bacterium]
MKPYQLTYIISPDITSEQAQTESKNIESIVQDKKGVVLKSEKPSAKTLAYPIKKQSSGFFGVLEFQLEPEYISELNENIQKNNRIIRHMIVINNPAKVQKERRIRKKPLMSSPFDKVAEETKERKTSKKVELKEIEKELDEILSE